MTADSRVPRPRLIALCIAVAAELLFLVNLSRPNQLVFDETHYIPAARQLLRLAGPINIEHPLLGKEIIALGIMLFGDNSFGWRFFSTLAATTVVVGIFALAWQILGRVRPAIFAALFTALNFTVFVQARIGMLDGFMAAFVVAGLTVLIWAMRGAERALPGRIALSAMLFGFAVATKWAAVPFVGFAGLAILLVNRRVAPALDDRRLVMALIFGALSVLVYFLSFAPAFFYLIEPLTFGTLLPFQLTMYTQQTQALPPHPYQSSWWTWPLDLRPIWYLYEPVAGVQRGILLIGNPAIIWGGLVAVVACAHAWWREGNRQLGLVAGLWLAAYLPWIVIPKKIGFFYYYYLPSIFLCLALAAALDHVGKARWRHADLAFAALAGGLFVYFYPILSAAPLAGPMSFLNWAWLESWR